MYNPPERPCGLPDILRSGYGRDYGDSVCTGPDHRQGVIQGYTADPYQGNIKSAAAERINDSRPLNGFGIVFGGGGVDRTDPEIIGSVRNRLLRFRGIMGGNADDLVLTEPLADRPGRQIILAHMDPVCIKCNRQLQVVIDDERNPLVPADCPELLSKL